MFMIRQEVAGGRSSHIKNTLRMKALIMEFNILLQKVFNLKEFIKSLIAKKILKKWEGIHIFLNISKERR